MEEKTWAWRPRRRKRDNQQSLVYRWEARINPGHYRPTMTTIEEVAQWAKPIWRAERGRVGLAKQQAPDFVPASWGQRAALSHDREHKISLPRWARSEHVVLHEMAHRLTPHDEAHGPRFVGVLIGLLARHAGLDCDEMMAAADEMGVKYHVRSIGAVPVIPLHVKLAKVIPATDTAAAIELGVHWRQVRGAAFHLIREGEARWYRGRLVPMRKEPAQDRL